eukprot:CAMPEP_0117653814 /NCGR_PEP_ID=MMETSP0804-20121206/3401_1 /TAXON_ID=1074897 /ORGANISM="Tetraselmis astigmatica, Strain CCMP880" /LENGTH=285 /DNA_ID=CAMNT_0005460033 /DNA_START=57 /DNA_END=915 /DNA_ORIENTATION=+
MGNSSSSKEITLTYFADGKGRSELPRLCLLCGGIKFTDERIGFEEYRRRRAAGELPFAQLPTLRVNGELLAQSVAIARWCAAEAGLMPTDRIEGAKVDMILDAWRDLHDEAYAVIYSREVEGGQLVMKPTPREGRQQKLADFFATTVRLYFSFLEGMLPPGPGPMHLVGRRLTAADLAVLDVFTFLESTRDKGDFLQFMAQFPRLQTLVDQLVSLSWIRKHLEEMPNESVAHAFKQDRADDQGPCLGLRAGGQAGNQTGEPEGHVSGLIRVWNAPIGSDGHWRSG